MSTTLNGLFDQMNNLGLTFRRNSAGELEVIGDTGRLTDDIRQAIGEHRQTILLCLPQASPAAAPKAVASPAGPAMAADAIRRQLDEFGLWLGRFAWWAQQKYLDTIDKRLAEAVDTQKPQTVAQQIEALRQEVDGINWAAEILPRAYEIEAKHATSAGAGPAEGSADGDGIPFGGLTDRAAAGILTVEVIIPMSEILEQVRQLIEKSGQSRYAIWKATGIPQQQLGRLMKGQSGLSLDSLERLLQHLGHEIKITKRRK